jgi:hypothetical protein
MILQIIMWVSWLMMLLLLWPVEAARPDVKPGCQDKCGDVSVPYPFGIGERSCAMNKHFFLNCSSNDELWFGRNMPVHNISQLEGTVTLGIDAAFKCYNKAGIQTESFPQSYDPWIRPLHVLTPPKYIHSYWLRYLCPGEQL